MAEDMPSGLGEGSIYQPAKGKRATPYFSQPGPGARTWPGIVLGGIGTAVAVAALIVALTRPTVTGTAFTTAVPTYTAGEVVAAQQQLCDTYKLAARAVQVDTAGTDKALARIATTNSAVMLENAAANPALDVRHRDAARMLATAYLTATAMGSRDVANDAEWQGAVDDVNAKDAVMKNVCNGG